MARAATRPLISGDLQVRGEDNPSSVLRELVDEIGSRRTTKLGGA
jgi:hypothetical protein